MFTFLVIQILYNTCIWMFSLVVLYLLHIVIFYITCSCVNLCACACVCEMALVDVTLRL